MVGGEQLTTLSSLHRGQMAHSMLQEGREARSSTIRRNPPRCAEGLVEAKRELKMAAPLHPEDAEQYLTLVPWGEHVTAQRRSCAVPEYAALIRRRQAKKTEAYVNARVAAKEHLIVDHAHLQSHRRAISRAA